MIKLGGDYLVLNSKLKNEADWEREFNLSIFGEISKIDMLVKWPFVEVKDINHDLRKK